MKKTRKSQTANTSDDMLPEYDFDYSKAKPNRFAGRIDRSQVVIALDPDVAKIFSDSTSVNNVLRALIATIPNLSA
ncbi:MAG: hypothetical protein ACRD82_07195, partial [Blastocatellia bacterium]